MNCATMWKQKNVNDKVSKKIRQFGFSCALFSLVRSVFWKLWSGQGESFSEIFMLLFNVTYWIIF